MKERSTTGEKGHDARTGWCFKRSIYEEEFEGRGKGALDSDGLEVEDHSAGAAAMEAK